MIHSDDAKMEVIISEMIGKESEQGAVKLQRLACIRATDDLVERIRYWLKLQGITATEDTQIGGVIALIQTATALLRGQEPESFGVRQKYLYAAHCLGYGEIEPDIDKPNW